jgi:protein-disulfide isomerase
MSGKNGHIMTMLMLALACITLVSPVLAEEKRYTVPVGDSPSYGPPDAPVTIIEFIDFQ